MTTLFAMRGYSGSGKSTKAREIANANNAVVVCRDNLRKMLLGQYWTGRKDDEDRVSIAELAQVRAFILAGTSVVVDATHLNPVYLRRWAKEASRMGADFQVVDVLASEADCRKHDHARMLAGGRYVGDKVISQQIKRFPQEKWPTVTAEPFVVEPVDQQLTEFGWQHILPEAIICDIDGTLAHIPEGGRSPFDYSNVLDDEVDETVVRILEGYKRNNPRGHIMLVSGRDDTCRTDTLKWLHANCVDFDRLIMRDPAMVDERGGKLPDYKIKYGIFNEHIRGKYNVLYVLDDRDQVVEMWRKLGLKCLQVAPGDF